MSAQPVSAAEAGRRNPLDPAALERVLLALEELRDGNFRRRLVVTDTSLVGRITTVINQIAQRNQSLVGELVAVREAVGQQGRTSERLTDEGGGGWSLATVAVNGLIDDLTQPTTELARVLAAVSEGDLSPRVSDQPLRGEGARLGQTVNRLLDQLSLFAAEVTRVAREVGTEGRLGGQAHVPGVAGTWRDLTDSVNVMAGNLTDQVRSIAQVATAVAQGDLSRKITVDARGEILELKTTLNTMVDQLSAFADEVTRVAHEVGSEGKLGDQARVRGVAGTWKALTDNVNFMAHNLTSQVRNIAQVTTAVANGDLSRKIDVDARGEILELKTTINTMVDRLSAFASEVTRVAREVGTEGKLGGQAEVIGVSGTWQRLTENVNRLAGNLTTQVRAIAAVATAVTAGDLTRQITVDASGEVAELKDNINQMVANLKEATRTNQDQDWLKTNLARLSSLLQGHRDLTTVASLVLSELAPLVCAQQGAFFLVRTDGAGPTFLEFTAGYGIREPATIRRFAFGESLVGQAALDKRTILVTEAPPDYAAISSGLGCAAPTNLLVLPLLFEGQVLGVIELASVNEFTTVHRDLLELLRETIGANVNTILANSRTEALLAESQRLAQELTLGSQRLQAQRHELQKSNTELAEKAALLATQNRAIEIKNAEIELARQEIEDRAAQLAAASRYKSDFMANMSHELRTPLNSALVLAKLLADNLDGNLSDKQIKFARTIHSAGSDLLQLINDILDLTKVEAGRMEPSLSDVAITAVVSYVKTLCEPLAAEKALHFTVELDPALPEILHTDEQRLQQVLRNLMSNAVKFTDEGEVALRIRPATEAEVAGEVAGIAARVAFEVADTGIGIATDKLSVIFEAFQQADGTTSRRYGGTGLGLSISRQLTQLLGGELTVRSEPGVGSVFTLYLPEVAGPPAPTVPAGTARGTARDTLPAPELVSRARSLPRLERHSARDETPPRFHGEKILIVDDDLRNVFALSSVLEAHDLHVVFADNGVAGVRALERNEDITLVLMDVMMPELDGNATIATIRNLSRYADLPIIAVTAKAMPEDRAKSLACGADDYVTKPVDTDLLLRLIHTYLGIPPDPE